MILYLDASALVKRYVAEPGSDVLRRAVDAAEARFMSRVGFVEVLAAIGRGQSPDAVDAFRSEWAAVNVVEVDEAVAERAAALALADGIRTLDALHLASALSLASPALRLATWDRRLHAGAQARGVATLPETLA